MMDISLTVIERGYDDADNLDRVIRCSTEHSDPTLRQVDDRTGVTSTHQQSRSTGQMMEST